MHSLAQLPDLPSRVGEMPSLWREGVPLPFGWKGSDSRPKQDKGINYSRQEITHSRGFAVFLLNHLKINKSFIKGHPIAFKRENRQGQDSSASHGSQSAHSRNSLSFLPASLLEAHMTSRPDPFSNSVSTLHTAH